MKTLNQWNESKLCLSNFLNIGDEVDEDIKDYILCVLPPVTWTKECIQMGEAYDHDDNGRARYLTIEKKSMGENWIYTGIKSRPRKEEQPTPPPKETPKTEVISLTSRSTRRQLRLNKACRSYGKNFKSGRTGVRYN